jgi:hypothetical protein
MGGKGYTDTRKQFPPLPTAPVPRHSESPHFIVVDGRVQGASPYDTDDDGVLNQPSRGGTTDENESQIDGLFDELELELGVKL